MRELTKELFASELEAMLEDMPLSKVRVTALCTRCDVSPQTFYYHFRDKYELVAWVFVRDFLGVGSGPWGYSREHLHAALSAMWGRHAFYERALDDHAQNSLADYLPEFFVHLVQSDGQTLSDLQMVEMWHRACGIAGLLSRWLRGDVEMNLDAICDYYNGSIPSYMADFMREHPRSVHEMMAHARGDLPE